MENSENASLEKERSWCGPAPIIDFGQYRKSVDEYLVQCYINDQKNILLNIPS